MVESGSVYRAVETKEVPLRGMLSALEIDPPEPGSCRENVNVGAMTDEIRDLWLPR